MKTAPKLEPLTDLWTEYYWGVKLVSKLAPKMDLQMDCCLEPSMVPKLVEKRGMQSE